MHSGMNVKIRGHIEKLPNIPIMSVTVPAFLRHYIRTYLCIAKNERIMKNLVFTIVLGVTVISQAVAQTGNNANISRIVKGCVVGENENPMGFATVAFLSDSVVIGGGITDINGTFDLILPEGAQRVQVSMMGYRMRELPTDSFPCTVCLQPDNVMLDGVVITASLPKTEIKGDAVVTHISGTVLEHSGNANDVLAKVPGMISTKDGIEVIGRGTPEYYINGRKVTDDSELRNLMSEDIKSVDVVSNPGALYGGDVRCVVRISTVKRQGDGFSFALTSQAKQHIYCCRDFEPSWSVLDLNYRTGGLDFFGKVVYWNQRNYQYSDMYDGTHTLKDGVPVSHFEDGIINHVSHYGGMQYVFGANWQINEKHSLGFKINRDHNYIGESETWFDTDVIINGEIEDHIKSYGLSKYPTNLQWNGNLYYDGNIGKLNVNLNLDFVDGNTDSKTETEEYSWQAPVKLFSYSESNLGLGAGKLVLSYPIGKGMLQAGAEETYVKADQKYRITKVEIPSSDASLKENTIAGFAQYSLSLPFGQISAGLRYEHADMNYDDYLVAANSVERHQDNWFPALSLATKLGPVNCSLSYTGKTVRPAYNMLTTEIEYNNRYAYQSGDPKLQNEKRTTLSLNANWKWLTFSSNYERVDNRFVEWGSPYGDDGVVMLKAANLDEPVRQLNFFINASPTIGLWSPRYTVGLQKQFLNMTVLDPVAEGGKRELSLNKPLCYLQLNNSFRFAHSLTAELNYQYTCPMHQDIYYISNSLHTLEVSIQKSFFKDDALTVRLTGTDLLNTNIQRVLVDYGSFVVDQTNDRCTPSLVLRVSYRFNSANDKYKGTGAGQDAKSRM